MSATSSAVSYTCGTSQVPLRYETIGHALDLTVNAHAEREALVSRHQGIRWMWAELGRRVDALAASLIASGLEVGDRVGIWSPTCAEWVLTQLATAKAGLILVTINPAYRPGELEHALRLSGCRALVLAQRFKTSDYSAMLLELAPELAATTSERIVLRRLPDLERVIQLGQPALPNFTCFEDLANPRELDVQGLIAERAARLTPDDPINIQFTSGTTGAPKGATLTHHNILNNGFFAGERMRFTHEDRLCIPLPLYHCFGMVVGVLNCVTHGSTMIFPGAAFDPQAVLETVQAERCTALYGVPSMFVAELAHPQFERSDLSTLRTGAIGGAPCPIEVMRRLVTDMHMQEVTICYGMTETSPVSFQSLADADLHTRVSTVGTVHPFVEVKIVDAAGKVVPRGQPGELLTRGYSVMAGYWNDPQRTAEAIDAAGWMHTGDLATLDEQGRCNVVGRLKDIIIRGGENIHPREIEEFLYRHPQVQAVQVFGVPDPHYGEAVCAWIQLREGEHCSAEEVLAFCRKQIAHYKVPRYLEFVTEFPMTVTGKVQKHVMRRIMAARLDLREQATA